MRLPMSIAVAVAVAVAMAVAVAVAVADQIVSIFHDSASTSIVSTTDNR